ncbi:MAG: type II secretion system F family protein [Planctomycetaceae bacterium]|jgi:general secretion pathway protein F|nr:type II secretion system F family protein [Planctomycetaceae bacterium]MBT6153813.1 type II secretion system F family protein [Planctomycetaceae bacterium]MBT6485742.1 type II secretion system F family protein [Planctomycetaceae bacterium]MBT6497899.1 type II secretion system F family protein [Planctomycetaceae bacterium]
MPDFQYTARELSGQQVTGTLTAPSKRDALSSLATQQLFPVRVEEAEDADARKSRLRRRVASRHLVVFYTQLADLLRSGVPLLRSLELLQRQAINPTLKLVLQEIREHIADGSRLAEAMRQHPLVFSELAVSMVRAGEEGSFMEDVLVRIATFTEHQQELKNRVVGTLIYPAFLTVAMTVVVTLMLVFFVPKFEPVFADLKENNELPWATTLLLGASDFAQNFWLLILAVLAAGGYGLFAWLKTDDGREKLDEFRIRAYGLGPVVRSLAIARFCRILGTLLRNGVPILQSLNIAKDATGNVILSRSIGAAAENISEGKSLASPLAGSGQFPDDVVEMIAVGEEANNLEQVLINIADSMERRTNRLLDIFVRMLEPALLTAMAGVVLFVVVALLLPILKSSSIM